MWDDASSAEAFGAFEEAVAMGSPDAMDRLGTLIIEGYRQQRHGAPHASPSAEDICEAIELFTRAADQGHCRALTKLGA